MFKRRLKNVTLAFSCTVLGAALALGACTNTRRSLNRGNSDLSELRTVDVELGAKLDLALEAPRGLGSVDLAADYQWVRLYPEERALARKLLQRSVDLTNDILSVDGQKGVALVNRDRIEARRTTAREYLRSLQAFEASVKPDYSPNAETRALPPYRRSVQI